MSETPAEDRLTKPMKRLILWTPLAFFAIFFGIAMSGLISPRDQTIESRMVGEPVPEFALEAALPDRPGLASTDFAAGDGPRLVNVFASWCVPCALEAPQLSQLQHAGVHIDAIAVRDRPEDIARFLQRYGDPFERVGADTDSRAQLALGSSGVPETFIVDSRGIIRHQHIGEIRPEDVPALLAALQEAE